jgi:hypothetical protein
MQYLQPKSENTYYTGLKDFADTTQMSSYHLVSVYSRIFLQILACDAVRHPFTYERKCTSTVQSESEEGEDIGMIELGPNAKLSRDIL